MNQGSNESSCVVKWDDSLAEYEVNISKGYLMAQEVEEMVDEQTDISSKSSSCSNISDGKSAMKSSLTLDLKVPDSPVNDGYTEPMAETMVLVHQHHCHRVFPRQHLHNILKRTTMIMI